MLSLQNGHCDFVSELTFLQKNKNNSHKLNYFNLMLFNLILSYSISFYSLSFHIYIYIFFSYIYFHIYLSFLSRNSWEKKKRNWGPIPQWPQHPSVLPKPKWAGITQLTPMLALDLACLAGSVLVHVTRSLTPALDRDEETHGRHFVTKSGTCSLHYKRQHPKKQ